MTTRRSPTGSEQATDKACCITTTVDGCLCQEDNSRPVSNLVPVMRMIEIGTATDLRCNSYVLANSPPVPRVWECTRPVFWVHDRCGVPQ